MARVLETDINKTKNIDICCRKRNIRYQNEQKIGLSIIPGFRWLNRTAAAGRWKMLVTLSIQHDAMYRLADKLRPGLERKYLRDKMLPGNPTKKQTHNTVASKTSQIL